jgi:hypothetical protein
LDVFLDGEGFVAILGSRLEQIERSDVEYRHTILKRKTKRLQQKSKSKQQNHKKREKKQKIN